MRTLLTRLEPIQLEVVMHIANGMALEEIAIAMHRSKSNVSYHIARARLRCQASNLPHLVSIAIATGDLIWEDEGECRVLSSHQNGARRSHPA